MLKDYNTGIRRHSKGDKMKIGSDGNENKIYDIVSGKAYSSFIHAYILATIFKEYRNYRGYDSIASRTGNGKVDTAL